MTRLSPDAAVDCSFGSGREIRLTPGPATVNPFSRLRLVVSKSVTLQHLQHSTYSTMATARNGDSQIPLLGFNLLNESYYSLSINHFASALDHCSRFM
ncbi:hypothetical protein M378DRAFT_651003 [Amanita muscaria Koide BX008]|uniref:Uncharacterized protein n=1 Tax=Amanita muscaria (strain Koide BX008) TaxID=946122 RepID=A0A0C2X3P3_AMAMK|nr:hypothetical protein M378DRAFT_651003 [Amanita muscaria Koide BX008]